MGAVGWVACLMCLCAGFAGGYAFAVWALSPRTEDNPFS